MSATTPSMDSLPKEIASHTTAGITATIKRDTI